MFREMRRNDRSLDKEQAYKLLENGKYGILSTSGENGYAYGVPLNYALYEGSIYFHCALVGSKLDNINSNNKVSFCVVGDSEPLPEKFSYRFESVIAFGKALEVDGMEKDNALSALIKKYSSEYMEKGIAYIKKENVSTKVIKIEIEHMTGKGRK